MSVFITCFIVLSKNLWLGGWMGCWVFVLVLVKFLVVSGSDCVCVVLLVGVVVFGIEVNRLRKG